MADDAAFPIPAGTVVSADDVGGKLLQNVKIDGGGNGLSVPIVAGQQLMANSLPVVIANDQTVQPAAASADVTAVSTSTSSANLIAVNTLRRGASIFNDSAVTMYVKFGATASSSDYTHALATATSMLIPESYGGQVDGILASSTGTARVTVW